MSEAHGETGSFRFVFQYPHIFISKYIYIYTYIYNEYIYYTDIHINHTYQLHPIYGSQIEPTHAHQLFLYCGLRL